MNRLTLLASLAATALVSTATLAQNAPAADNSASNSQTRSGAQLTADDQSNSKADIELTQRIRRSVMDDKSLSTYGKNVKIVSVGGKVTLNGVVHTADEKKRIGTMAASAAGAGNVVNELKVTPEK